MWLTTQIVAGYLVVMPMLLYLAQAGQSELMFIPMLITGIGDTLAEPVGVRFGAHRYAVRALFTHRMYTRSLEGSACILVTGLLAIVRLV